MVAEGNQTDGNGDVEDSPLKTWADAASKRIEQVLAAHDERVQSLQRTVARIEREVFPVHTMHVGTTTTEDTGYTARIKTKCASAACALTQASEDFDAIQRRALELIVNMKHDGANPDVVIALADIATSLGDCSAACTLAAREARR